MNLLLTTEVFDMEVERDAKRILGSQVVNELCYGIIIANYRGVMFNLFLINVAGNA